MALGIHLHDLRRAVLSKSKNKFSRTCELPHSSPPSRRPVVTLHWLTFWYDTGIHECGQREIGNHEKYDDTLIRGHPWMTENVILASRLAKRENEIDWNCQADEFEITRIVLAISSARCSRRKQPQLIKTIQLTFSGNFGMLIQPWPICGCLQFAQRSTFRTINSINQRLYVSFYF